MLVTPGEGRGMPENAIAYDGPIDCIGTPLRIAGAIHDLIGATEANRSTFSQDADLRKRSLSVDENESSASSFVPLMGRRWPPPVFRRLVATLGFPRRNPNYRND
jgi:hypothetical protein